jgi:chromosome segregation ATPase
MSPALLSGVPVGEMPLLAELQTDLHSEIAALRAAIDREADATDSLLRQHRWGARDVEPGSGPTELTELDRQLSALRTRVARALRRDEDQVPLRAELATLLSFANTLRADVEACHAAFEEALSGIERREQEARAEQERLAAEHGALVRRRDALQSQIDQTAARMAQDIGGECRRTVPVLTLAAAITVCSSIVVCPRRRFRSDDRWLVTLNDTRDQVMIRRSYA